MSTVTILYPCYNEEEAIADCVDAAMAALAEAGLEGEVLVVDNNSVDRSADIAREHGARVVTETRQGYGNAYLRGFAEAQTDYIVMLDADATYPVEMTGRFVEILDGGAEFVLGNRFAGQMARDAMPFLNRYVGNPILSGMTRLLFKVSFKDMHCGMRGLRRDVVPRLALHSGGMEFATEMVVKALDADVKVVEVGIPYRPRVGESKLQRFRDAWRHVEYMMVFSPGLFLLLPGLALMLAGFAVEVALLGGPADIFFRTWDVHANVGGLAAVTTGTTLLGLGLVSTHYAASIGMTFRHSALGRLGSRVTDRTLRWIGLGFATSGATLWGWVFVDWLLRGMGALSAVPFLTLATALLTSGVELLAVAFIIHVVRSVSQRG